MKKNLLKIGVLALGMFAFGALMTETSNAQEVPWDVSLTILSGTSYCNYGTSLYLGAQNVLLDTAYVFSGNFTEKFICYDYRGNSFGATWGWDLYIRSANLYNERGSVITSGNVSIRHTAGVVTGDVSCTAWSSTATRTPINNNYSIIQRAAGTDGICSVSVDTVSLKVDVLANQAPGAYSGTLTLTIPAF